MSYDVFTKDGRPAGTLRLTARGPRWLVEYTSDLDPGVSRLVLAGPEGAVSLGIPEQYAGGLRLTRTLTRLTLGDFDLEGEWRALLLPAEEDYSRIALTDSPPGPEAKTGEDTRPAPEPEEPPEEWSPEPDPARHFKDPALAASAGKIRGALTMKDGEETLLAFPWTPSAPFPMIEAFRLGAEERIGDAEYIVFRIRDGEPV